MYFLPDLTEKLIDIANKNLPLIRGQRNKVLEVIVQFNYGKYTEGWLKGEPENEHIKVVFWQPNNYVLVGYSSDTHAEDIPNDFTISANHDSTWKHDGLNFFSKILNEPKVWNIISTTMHEVDVLEYEQEFRFNVLSSSLV